MLHKYLIMLAAALSSRLLMADTSAGAEGCVPCDVLFSKLDATPSGKRIQHVEIQLRGEPKSGTGFMHQWASGMLYHTCNFLKQSFGEDTCHVGWFKEDPHAPAPTNRSLIFEPHQDRNDVSCPCHDVQRVVISVSKFNKHTLPVDPSCAWWHSNKIAAVGERGTACKTVGGRPVGNYSDLLRCMLEADCEVKDDRNQLIVMRDPRPVAVSAYFHKFNGGILHDVSLQKYVLQILPNICMWATIRYVLFAGVLERQSDMYWYDDAIADPLAWHYKFLHSVGVHLPSSVVVNAKDAALRNEFDFVFKRVDHHSEGRRGEYNQTRSWQDEVGADHLHAVDEILRLWLPPVLLAKLGVSFA